MNLFRNFLLKNRFNDLLFYGAAVFSVLISSALLFFILILELKPELYAEIILAKSLILIFCTLGGLGLSQAAVKWNQLHRSKSENLGSILLGSFLSSLAIGFLINGFFLFTSILNFKLTLLFSFLIFIMTSSNMINNELINWLRATQKVKKYAFFSFVRSILQFSLILYLCLNLQPVQGYILGFLLSESILLIILIFNIYTPLKYNFSTLKEMITYGFPHSLIISSTFLLNYLDRWLISFFGTLKDVAIYDAASLVIVGILSILLRPFNLYIFPEYMHLYKSEGNQKTIEFINKMQRDFILLSSLVALVLIIFKTSFLNLIFPSEYLTSQTIFLPLAFTMILKGIYITSVAGLYISDRTSIVGYVCAFSVLLNISLNILFIPKFGIIGAAYSSLVSNLTLLCLSNYFSKKIININFPLKYLSLSFILLSLANYF